MAGEISRKHQQFINEYIKLKCSNATEAYCRVYPKSSREAARVSAHEILTNPNISTEIDRRVTEETMSANEVLMRIAEHGRGDIGEFIDLGPEEIKESERSHLIKKFTRTVTTTVKKDYESTTESLTLELYDALAAKTLIGRHHNLFTDRTELNATVNNVQMTLADWKKQAEASRSQSAAVRADFEDDE